MIIYVKRTSNTSDGVFGTMEVDGLTLCTMEDDDKDNLPGESCIPAGEYKLHRTVYHAGGYETFEILDVPNRQRILIHRANTEEDVKGCIGVGLRVGELRVRDEDDPAHPYVMKRAVVASREAFTLFMDKMKDVDDGKIIITWNT